MTRQQMKRQICFSTLRLLAILLAFSIIIGCNTDNKEEINSITNLHLAKETLPDSVVRFLIASAAHDFRMHRPPTPADFRNIEMGYIPSSDNEIIYIMCGEFLSKEKREWVAFTTIKTSGYEQYIGKTQYCQDATILLKDEYLSDSLKNQLAN